MDVASSPRGTTRIARRAARWRKPRGSYAPSPVGAWLALFVLSTLCTGQVGCVALPDVQPPQQTERRIVINKNKVTPSLLAPVKIDLSELGVYFEIPSAIETSPPDLDTEIYWFYDYDKELGLPIANWQTCGGTEQCFLTICNRPQPNASRHHLWVVVSDGKYKSSAKKPFDFEDGAVFDAVVWEIEPEPGTQCLN